MVSAAPVSVELSSAPVEDDVDGSVEVVGADVVLPGSVELEPSPVLLPLPPGLESSPQPGARSPIESRQVQTNRFETPMSIFYRRKG